MSDASVRAYVAQRRFSAATAQRWLRRSAADQAALLHVASDLRLGENHVRDLLDALEAIAARHGDGFAEILAQVGTTTTSERRPVGRNERLRHLKVALRRLQFPQLTAAERRLRELIKRLRLPAGVVVELPENLEGDEITVTVRGASAGQLRDRFDQAAMQLRAGDVDEMFRVLGGES